MKVLLMEGRETYNPFKEYLSLFLCLIFIILIGVAMYNLIYEPYSEYKTYKNFCEDKPDFCYCDHFQCEFKTSYSQKCVDGNCSNYLSSDETKELCKLATQLNDREMMFKSC